MATSDLKRGLSAASEAPDTAPSPSGAEAEYYEWTEPRGIVIVQNFASSPATMYVRVPADEASDASTTVCDVVLAPGDPPFTNGGKFDVKGIAVYFTAAATFGTHFLIRGW